MKKLIFCDIDGTIVDGSRGLFNPSDKTKHAFKQLCKDNYVFIASGRNRSLLPKNITDLNPSGYVLCNGAYAEINNVVIYQECFKEDDISLLIDYIKKNSGFYILESIDKVFCDDLNNPAFKAFMNTWGMGIQGFNEYNNEFSKEDLSVAMVGFLSEEPCLNLSRDLKDYFSICRHLQFKSFDINIKNIDKSVGVKRISKYLGIDYENTYAFGDGINDLEMLQAVRHPVVMDNCAELLKKYDFEKTDDVLWDGFYNYLIRNKLIKQM